MKVNFTIASLCLLVVASWAFFTFVFLALQKENVKLGNYSDLEAKMDYLNDTVDVLWEERVFGKEMEENLSYYLPEGFSGKARYTGLSPIDLELGKAHVYFTHQGKKHTVDFSYHTDSNRLKIERESEVNIAD